MSPFSLYKSNLINLVKGRRCQEIKVIQQANTYTDLLNVFFQFAGLFDCDVAYMEEILNLFDDSVLLGNRIYYNKNAGGNVDNPKAIINSTFDNVNLNTGTNYGSIEILGASRITNVTIGTNTQVFNMGIGGGAEVDVLNVISGSCIETLIVKGCNGNNSTLNKIVEGSCIKDLGIDENAIFNGFICDLTPQS